MPTYSVMVSRTRTSEQSVEIEVTAKDEEKAQEKAEAQIDKAIKAGKLEELDWETTNEDDSFEYEATEN